MTATAATTAPAVPIDLDKMLHVMAELRAMADPDPIADWMRGLGFAPEDGYVLVLPASMFRLAASMPRKYVWCSALALEPVIIDPQYLQFDRPPRQKPFFQPVQPTKEVSP